MAYMDQEKKAKLAPAIKAVLKKYGIKGTLGVRHHSTLICNISSGSLDIIGNMYAVALERPGTYYADGTPSPTYIQVNPYYISENYTGKVRNFLVELISAMNVGNHDRSDSQTDYFDVGFYINVNVGQWNKPYQFVS